EPAGSGGRRGGGCAPGRAAFTDLALLRGALDAQLDRSQTGNDDDERNDLYHAERRDRAVAAALLPHGQTGRRGFAGDYLREIRIGWARLSHCIPGTSRHMTIRPQID